MPNQIPQKFIDKFLEQGFAVSSATGCWLWLGTMGPRGYGRVSIKSDGKKKSFYAHRVACAAYGIDAPFGLVADHLCRNRLCVNPKHIDFCSNKENINRGKKGAKWEKERCIRGHLFAPENTQIYGRGRNCLECKKTHWGKNRKGKHD